jgi:hypothetical protein
MMWSLPVAIAIPAARPAFPPLTARRCSRTSGKPRTISPVRSRRAVVDDDDLFRQPQRREVHAPDLVPGVPDEPLLVVSRDDDESCGHTMARTARDEIAPDGHEPSGVLTHRLHLVDRSERQITAPRLAP